MEVNFCSRDITTFPVGKAKQSWHGQRWMYFLRQGVRKRLSGSEVLSQVNNMRNAFPVPSRTIAKLLVRLSRGECRVVDGLIIEYLEVFLNVGLIVPSDILAALYQFSSLRKPNKGSINENNNDDFDDNDTIPGSELRSKTFCSAGFCQIVFDLISRYIVGSSRLMTSGEVRCYLTILWVWLDVFAQGKDNQETLIRISDNVERAEELWASCRDSLGGLAISGLESRKFSYVFSRGIPRVLCYNLARSLAGFCSVWLKSSPLSVSRLINSWTYHRQWFRGYPFIQRFPILSSSLVCVESVHDFDVVHTRGGLFILINSLLTDRPLTYDWIIINYVRARYGENGKDMTIDLIIASFDVLSNAKNQCETRQTLFSFRSFLINKLPPILGQLSQYVETCGTETTVESCIEKALAQIDSVAFPPFSDSFMDNGNNVLSDVRQDFIFACAMHGLVTATSVESLLGDRPLIPPPTPDKRYDSTKLIELCESQAHRIEQLINELETLDGNADIKVCVLVELMNRFSQRGDRARLKKMCNTLSRKYLSLDVIMQFTTAERILKPLCCLIDRSSGSNKDNTDDRIVIFEEFSGILLLIRVILARFGISYRESGLDSKSFIARYMGEGHLVRTMDQLTQRESEILSSWIRTLYTFKSNNQRAIHELLGSCQPEELSLLTTTLFDQILTACSQNDGLGLDYFKEGLTCFLEPCLITMLIGMILWMVEVNRQNNKKVEQFLRLMTLLTKCKPKSSEASAMRDAVLSVVNSSLTRWLHCMERQTSKSGVDGAMIRELIEFLKPYDQLHRWKLSTRELEGWNEYRDQGGGEALLTALQDEIKALNKWNSLNEQQSNVINYNHHLLLTSLRVHNASHLMTMIINECVDQTYRNNGPVALDVAVSIICSSSIVKHILNDTTMSSLVDNLEFRYNELCLELSNFHDSTMNPDRIPFHLLESGKPHDSSVDNNSDNKAFSPLRTPELMINETVTRLYRRVSAFLGDFQRMSSSFDKFKYLHGTRSYHSTRTIVTHDSFQG